MAAGVEEFEEVVDGDRDKRVPHRVKLESRHEGGARREVRDPKEEGRQPRGRRAPSEEARRRVVVPRAPLNTWHDHREREHGCREADAKALRCRAKVDDLVHGEEVGPDSRRDEGRPSGGEKGDEAGDPEAKEEEHRHLVEHLRAVREGRVEEDRPEAAEHRENAEGGALDVQRRTTTLLVLVKAVAATAGRTPRKEVGDAGAHDEQARQGVHGFRESVAAKEASLAEVGPGGGEEGESRHRRRRHFFHLGRIFFMS